MRLLLAFVRAYPGQSAVMLLCLLLGAVAEAVGLSTLLPILTLATGEAAGAEGGNAFARGVTGALERVGLTANFETLLLVLLGAIYLQGALLLFAKRRVGFAVANVATRRKLARSAASSAGNVNCRSASSRSVIQCHAECVMRADR